MKKIYFIILTLIVFPIFGLAVEYTNTQRAIDAVISGQSVMIKSVFVECLKREPTEAELIKYKITPEKNIRNNICPKTSTASTSPSITTQTKEEKDAIELSSDLLDKGTKVGTDLMKDGLETIGDRYIDTTKDAIRDSGNLIGDDIDNTVDLVKKPNVKNATKLVTDHIKNYFKLGKNIVENFVINPVNNLGKMTVNAVKNISKTVKPATELAKKAFDTSFEVTKEGADMSFKLVKNHFIDTPVNVVKKTANVYIDTAKDTIDFIKKPSINNATKIIANGINNEIKVVKAVVDGFVVKPINIVSDAVGDVTKSIKKAFGFGGGSSRKPLMSEAQARVLAAQLIRDELRREPDSVSLGLYTNNVMWDGVEAARKVIRSSAEYEGLNAKEALGAYSVAEKNAAEAKVRSVWLECFGRKPNDKEMSTFKLRFLSHPDTIQQEIKNICNTPAALEYKASQGIR